MFTFGAVVLIAIIGLLATSSNTRGRPEYHRAPSEFREWILLLHARQDLRLIAFLLGGVIVMLGIVADRVG